MNYEVTFEDSDLDGESIFFSITLLISLAIGLVYNSIFLLLIAIISLLLLFFKRLFDAKLKIRLIPVKRTRRRK